MSRARPVAATHQLPHGVVRDLVEGQVLALERERRALRERPRGREALHRFRVASRRVEAAVGLAEWAMRPTQFHRAIALAARPPRGTARFRNADVLELRLRDLAEEAPPRERPTVDALAATAAAERARGRKQAVTRATGRAAPRELRRPLLRLLDAADPAALGDAIGFPATRVRLRAARLGGADEEGLHAFRLEMKAFRYALEAVADHAEAAEACPVAAEAAEAREVTALLGRLNDAEALRASVGRWVGGLPRRVRREAVAQEAVARLLAAADAEREGARGEFLAGWHGARWPALKALLGLPMRAS